MASVQDATSFTRASNRAGLDALPFADTQDFEDARRGFLATLPEVEIKNDQGRVVWSLREYAFLDDAQAPPTVNPSLWRQARLNMQHGLFQVTEGIYQVRGFDISNMTLIEGERGVIVIDPLISTEVARAALELYLRHRGPRPVTAVIYSHSHTDHYGGVRGVVDEGDVRAGGVEVWAPDRFMQEIVSENVLAGTAMVRRAQFQFGATLPKGPRGQVDAGLGKVTSRGRVTLIPPTRIVTEPIEVHRIDGVEVVFQLTPETEAPAEMHMFYLAVRLDGEKAEGWRLVINWVFPDLDRRYVSNLENCALTCLADRQSDRADATVTVDRAVLNRLLLREMPFADAAQGGLLAIDGDAARVAELFTLFDDFPLMFEVVEPKREHPLQPR